MKTKIESLPFMIPNWDDFQGRIDRKNYQWFKFSSDFLIDEKILLLKPSAKLLFLHALCVKNKSGASHCSFNVKFSCNILGTTEQKLINDYNKILELGLICLPLDTKCLPSDTIMVADGCPIREDKNKNKIRLDKSYEGVTDVPTSPPEKSLGSKIFEAYADAYRERYGVEPARNARVNSQCNQLGQRLGEEAIPIAVFFVRHNGRFYVQKSHPIGALLADAESLRTEWLTGKQVTVIEAIATENRQQLVNSFGKFLTPEGGSNGEL